MNTTRVSWTVAGICLISGFITILLWHPDPQEVQKKHQTAQVVSEESPDQPIKPIEDVLEAVPYVEPAPRVRPSRLRILDALSDRPLRGVILTFGEDRSDGIAETNRDGIVELVADLKDKVRAVATLPESFGGQAFEVSWEEGAEEGLLQDSTDTTYDLRLPAFARIFLEVRGFDLNLHERLIVSATPLAPLPEESHPAYRSLKLHREFAPKTYPIGLKTAGLKVEEVARPEVIVGKESCEVYVPYTGEIGLQCSLKGYLTKSLLCDVVQGQEIRVNLVLEETPTVSGKVRIDGEPARKVTVAVTCATELSPGELMAYGDQERAGIAIARKRHEAHAQASTTIATETDAEGRYSVEVPFTDRVTVCVSKIDASNRLVRKSVGKRDESVVLDIDASSTTARTQRMRLLDALTELPLSGLEVSFAIVDDPFWVTYPPLRSDSEGWFSVDDFWDRRNERHSMVFIVMRNGEMQRFDLRPTSGGIIRVN